MEEPVQPDTLDATIGIGASKTDEKGRLKLPVEVQRWLESHGDTTFYATSFDEREARIYPLSEWVKTKALLLQSGEDAEMGEDLYFTAMDLGGGCQIDSQGRIVLPANLRRTLGLENATCHLQPSGRYLNVYNDEVYEERRQRARENRAAKLSVFKKRGL